MSVHLRLQIILAALFGALLIISIGTALQFRQIAVSAEDLLGPDARLLEAAAEMQRLLGGSARGPAFEQAFRGQLAEIEDAETTYDEQQFAAEINIAFEELMAQYQVTEQSYLEEKTLAEAVGAFTAQVGREATQSAEIMASHATNAAVALGMLGVIALIAGAGVFRNVRSVLLQRLTALDQAAVDIHQGDSGRRVAVEGTDEIARIGHALNSALDLRDRGDAEMRGRNREVRALLVALLREWPRAAAITGIDGELIVSTLSTEEEERLRSLTPQVRKAASILLSRGFVAAAELSTDISFPDGSALKIRALALGEQRIVGWFAEFVRQ